MDNSQTIDIISSISKTLDTIVHGCRDINIQNAELYVAQTKRKAELLLGMYNSIDTSQMNQDQNLQMVGEYLDCFYMASVRLTSRMEYEIIWNSAQFSQIAKKYCWFYLFDSNSCTIPANDN